MTRIQGTNRYPKVTEKEDGSVTIAAESKHDEILKGALNNENLIHITTELSEIAQSDRSRIGNADKTLIALQQMDAMAPRDEVEVLLCEQMIKTQNLHTQAVSIASNPDLDLNLRRQWMDMTSRLARTYTTQVESLRRYRSGGEQIVKHIHVNEGGQAAFIEKYEGAKHGE